MKLITFLGNPGLRYRKTRHNVGFMVGDFCAKHLGARWKLDKKFAAEIARHDETILAKPQLFYNRTGESVQKIMQFYKIAKLDILVVCDDLNLEFGKVRFRASGSAGGNNGLQSIIDQIGPDFARIRIGTDNATRPHMDQADFVLSKLRRDEYEQLTAIAGDVTKIIDEFLADH